jgi:ribulose-5-phosphate 4-epimerase/fuculose-1-phosphate aldolase
MLDPTWATIEPVGETIPQNRIKDVETVQTPPLADPAVLRDLIIANRILAQHGVLDTMGHVSIRHPEEPHHYLIGRAIGPERMKEDDLQRFTLEGEQVSGNSQPGYAERAIHGAIYAARPDVLAVCHNHSASIIPFGTTGVALRPIMHMAGLLGSDVPVWEPQTEFGDTDMLVRTLDQGQSLARALGPRRVALMRGHGSVVAGDTLREVVLNSVFMEQNARLQFQSMVMGTPQYLSEGEIKGTQSWLLSDLAQSRTWDTWAGRVAYRG